MLLIINWWARRVSWFVKKINKLLALSGAFAFVLLASAIVFGKNNVKAQELVQEPSQQSSENKQAETYNYVAQPGDSYSLMARKAIQTYGVTNKVNLSKEQIIFAETNLTQTAGSPVLAKGQKVEIKQADVKNWVEKAQKLTKEQQAAWSVYAKTANFNTNNVGQPSK